MPWSTDTLVADILEQPNKFRGVRIVDLPASCDYNREAYCAVLFACADIHTNIILTLSGKKSRRHKFAVRKMCEQGDFPILLEIARNADDDEWASVVESFYRVENYSAM